MLWSNLSISNFLLSESSEYNFSYLLLWLLAINVLEISDKELFKKIAYIVNKYSKTPGQIILNWHLSQGIIAIPGTSNPQRMKENLASAQFDMDENDFQFLSKRLRTCWPELARFHSQ